MAKAQHILESVYSDTSLNVDEAAGVIRNVRIIGPDSKNRRKYSPRALSEAAALYEGRDVFIDHNRSRGPAAERGLLEGLGVLRDVRQQNGGVFGDLHYLKTHEAAAPVVERAQRFPTTFGLSHDATGTVKPGRNGSPDLVESIEHVESVDLVKKPATNNGLFESQEPTVKTPLKTLLETHKRLPLAGKLKKLLEDDFSAMGGMPEAPVETPEDAAPEDQIDEAVKSMVLAIVDDDSLDAAAKLAKIKLVLNAADNINDTGGGGDTKPPADDTPVTESMVKRLEAVERRQNFRELLESQGLTYTGLSQQQRQLLDKQSDIADAQALIESWPRHQLPRGEKPRIRSALKESDTGKSYDELKKELRRA